MIEKYSACMSNHTLLTIKKRTPCDNNVSIDLMYKSSKE